MRFALTAILLAGIVALPASVRADAPAAAASVDGPLKVESYYRVGPGGMGEFLRVYHKQREVLLKEMMRQGYISEIAAEMPFTHVGGTARWDFRTSVTYRHGADGVGAGAAYKAAMAAARARLFPDKAAFDAEEARRGGLTQDHWDIVIEVAP